VSLGGRTAGNKLRGIEMASKRSRDIEKGYPQADFVAKLRRLADAIENGERFAIQIAGERIFVPAKAIFNIEHERSGNVEEIEFQIRWSRQ
jgi:amphi-Trp domain-containing protein